MSVSSSSDMAGTTDRPPPSDSVQVRLSRAGDSGSFSLCDRNRKARQGSPTRGGKAGPEEGEEVKLSAQLKSQADWIFAIGETRRLSIIRILASGERGVPELAKLLGSPIMNVSRHLKSMSRAGLVT